MEWKERGNALFRDGKFVEAIEEYERGLASPECEESVRLVLQQNLALSLRKAGRTSEALQACARHPRPTAKVVHCHATLLFEAEEYKQALDVIRNSSHGADGAVTELEKSIRQSRIFAASRGQLDKDLRGLKGAFSIMSSEAEHSFERCILEAMVKCPTPLLQAKKGERLVMHWIGARDEVHVSLDELVRKIKCDVDVYCIGPDIDASDTKDLVVKSGKHAVRWYSRKQYYSSALVLPHPDLCCMFCPGFDLKFTDWYPGVNAALAHRVPVVVTGYSRDQSLVQDEDILASFGAEVLVPPFLTNCGISAGYAIKNSHCLVVTGKADFKEVSKAEASNIKASLKARGFEIP